MQEARTFSAWAPAACNEVAKKDHRKEAYRGQQGFVEHQS